MKFRTIIDIPIPNFSFKPCERVLFVGSCFADNIGKRFKEEKFRTIVNPFGAMYNPVSILHTVQKLSNQVFDIAVFTLGTNHVYVEKATGEIVDNCQKRPQKLFNEQELTIDEAANALREAIHLLRKQNPNDMLHPNDQAVEYIWERLVATCFSSEAKKFLEAWRPIKEALGHRPFNPDSEAYRLFMQKTKEKIQWLKQLYPDLELDE